MTKTIMPEEFMGDIHDMRARQERAHLTKFRIWYLLLILIVAAGVGYGLWWYITTDADLNKIIPQIQNQASSTNNDEKADTLDTSGWKTFADSALGYSFKYPKEWDINAKVLKPTGKYDQIVEIKLDPDPVIENETVAVSEPSEFWISVYNQKYSTYYAARKKDSSFKSQTFEKATLVSVDGQKAEFTASGGGKQNDIILPVDENKTIVFSYLSASNEKETITNMLKSVRFE